MTLEIIIPATLATIGGLSWLLRLEGRVNTGEALHNTLKDSHAELKADVRYIRDRIDRALHGRHES